MGYINSYMTASAVFASIGFCIGVYKGLHADPTLLYSQRIKVGLIYGFVGGVSFGAWWPLIGPAMVIFYSNHVHN